MKFSWWYVSMGITSGLVFGGMVYLGNFVCVPVENGHCASLLPLQGTKIPAVISNSTEVNPEVPANLTGSTNTTPPGTGGTVPPNGNKIDFTLSFQVSSDSSKYGFNGTIGSPSANPDITVHSGDTVTIHLSNPSKSFHAFGIVIDPENPNSVLWDSAFKTPDSPMKPGEKGDTKFVAGTPGLYHYICTVPGHAELGMDGNLIIK